MGRKIPILLSTLAVLATNCCVSSTPTYAEFEHGGDHFWSVEEIIDYEQQLHEARDGRCGDDASCREQDYLETLGNNTLHATDVDIFNTQRVVFTSINPTTNEVKFMFHGAGSSWELGTGYGNYRGELSRLHIVWLDEDVTPPDEDMSWFNPETEHFHPYYVDEILSGDINPGTHVVYAYKKAENEPGYINWNEEMGTVITNTNDLLKNNTRRMLYYNIIENYTQTSDMTNYSSCLDSGYYEDGMECRLVFSENQGMLYTPYTSDGIPAMTLRRNNIDGDTNNQSQNDLNADGGQAQDDPTSTLGDSDGAQTTNEPNDGTIPGQNEPNGDMTQTTNEPYSGDYQNDLDSGTNTDLENEPTSILGEENSGLPQETKDVSENKTVSQPLRTPDTGNYTKKSVSRMTTNMIFEWGIGLFASSIVFICLFLLPKRKSQR